MKKFIIGVAAVALALVALGVQSANANNGNGAFNGKVTICHATSSETNPYVRINVSVNALKNSGHGTVNLEVALATIGNLNPGADLTPFIEIGGHTGDIFLIDQENDLPCPETPEEGELVTADLCLEGEAVEVGPSFQADVDAEVARLVELGATVGDCPVVEETTTTTVVEETTTTTETPVLRTVAPVVPVVETAPVAPVSAPVALPHTL